MTIASICGAWDVSWPWPQVFVTDFYILAATLADWEVCKGNPASGISTLVLFELYNDANAWNAIPVANLGDPDLIEHIDVAGFGKFYVVAASGYDGNGDPVTTCLMRDPTLAAAPNAITSLPTEAAPTFITACNYNNQCLVGGVISSDANWCELGLHSVLWSGISMFDFRITENRTAGFTHMPWGEYGKGRILRIMKFGNSVIVYGDTKKGQLVPFTQQHATGYAQRPILGPGIRSANHVAGDETVHAFIDSDGELWTITQNVELTRLGYKEFLAPLIDGATVTRVSYASTKRRFYISNGVTGYVLTEHGLYSTHQLPTSIVDYHGKILAGFFADSADVKVKLKSDTLTFGDAGLKRVPTLEIGATYSKSTNKLKAGVDYAYTYNRDKDMFSLGNLLELNSEGVCYPGVTAPYLRIKLEADDYRDSSLSITQILPRINFIDKRSVRGRANVG